MSDYSELKSLAESATHRKWSTSGSYVAPTREDGLGTVYVEDWCSIALVPGERNRKFIAAANPATVLALIAEVEFLKESRKEARDERNRFGDQLDAADLKIEQLKAEVEALHKDAERYRAIRDEIPHVDLDRAILDIQSAAEYDAAIDDAMSKESNQ